MAATWAVPGLFKSRFIILALICEKNAETSLFQINANTSEGFMYERIKCD